MDLFPVSGFLSFLAIGKLSECIAINLFDNLLILEDRAFNSSFESVRKKCPLFGRIKIHVGVGVARGQAKGQGMQSGDKGQPVPKVDIARMEFGVMQNI